MSRSARFQVEFTKTGDGAVRAAIQSMGKEAETSAARANASGRDWEDFGRKIGTSMRWAGGVAAVGLALIIKNTIDAERVNAQLESRLESLGSRAAVTRQQIDGWNESLVRATKFDDDSINEAATALLAFTNIRADEFERSLSLALDLAESKSIDAATAAEQLGLALNDPVKAMRSLRDEGVALSETQVQLVKDLVAAGREAEAQQILLGELEARYGDAAEAARDTLGGAVRALMRDLGELTEGEGGSLEGSRQAVESLIDTINDPAVQQGFDTIVKGALDVANTMAAAIPSIVEFSSQLYGALSRVSEYLAGRHEELRGTLFGDAELARRGAVRSQQAVAGTRPDFSRVSSEPADFSGVSAARADFSNVNAPPPPSSKKTRGSGKDSDGAANRAAAEAARERARAERELQQQLEAVAEAQADFTLQSEDLAAQLSGPLAEAQLNYQRNLKELRELAREGEIGAEQLAKAEANLAAVYEQEAEAIRRRLEPGAQLLDDLRFELDLVRMGNAERATAIQLRGMEADQVEKYGAAILEANRNLEAQHEALSDQIETMDGIRDAGKGLISDLAKGVDPIEAMNDAWDRLYAKLVDIAAENLMDQIFGRQGEPAGGSTGGWLGSLFNAFSGGSSAPAAGSAGEQGAFDSWFNAANGGGGTSGGGFWAGLLSSVFGGGRADGGTGMPNRLYRVNERGFEMASVGGKDYMMVGPQPVQITPHEALGGGGGGSVFNFKFDAPTSTRTQAQLGSRVQYALARNQRNR